MKDLEIERAHVPGPRNTIRTVMPQHISIQVLQWSPASDSLCFFTRWRLATETHRRNARLAAERMTSSDKLTQFDAKFAGRSTSYDTTATGNTDFIIVVRFACGAAFSTASVGS